MTLADKGFQLSFIQAICIIPLTLCSIALESRKHLTSHLLPIKPDCHICEETVAFLSYFTQKLSNCKDTVKSKHNLKIGLTIEN